jgi:hypothetical protein
MAAAEVADVDGLDINLQGGMDGDLRRVTEIVPDLQVTFHDRAECLIGVVHIT